MKKQILRSAFFGAVLTVAAFGQNNSAVLKADIPFSFVVANRTLPPGQYVLSNVTERTVRITNPGKQTAIVQTGKVLGHAPESAGKLVFYRYQDTYFLAQVWDAGSDTGKLVYRSKAEEEMLRRGLPRETATLREAQARRAVRADSRRMYE
jgi:hypothetical protein